MLSVAVSNKCHVQKIASFFKTIHIHGLLKKTSLVRCVHVIVVRTQRRRASDGADKGTLLLYYYASHLAIFSLLVFDEFCSAGRHLGHLGHRRRRLGGV